MNWLAVGIGGAAGSVVRYGLARWAGKTFEGIFPWGTLLVNLGGAFLMGVLTGIHPAPLWMLLIGTGFMGGLTTFSTWMLESVRLVEEGEWIRGFGNLTGTLTVGLLLFELGRSLG